MKRVGNVIFAVLTVGLLIATGWLLLSRFGVVSPPPIASAMTPTSKGSAKHKLAYLSQDDPSVKEDDLGPRKWKIVDVHEHAKGEVEAKQLLRAMDAFGIQRTVLMASTIYTLTLNPIYGFEGFKENNEAVIDIKKKWPERFTSFVTFDPCSPTEDNLALVKDYVARGADGVKLYIGHGATTPKFAFHCMPIDDPKLEPFFAWAEEVSLPILMHVNLEKYWGELLNVLEKHPHLRVTLPHFGLHKNTAQRLARLGFLLDRYPYVFTDISFGFHTFQLDGFEVLAKFRTRSREFLEKYKHKVMYASDMVLEPSKDDEYVFDTLRSYLQFLEMERWRFNLVPSKTMHGMGLDDDTLRHIYEVAPKSFLLLDDKGMSPDRTKGWPLPGVVVDRTPLPPLVPESIPPLRKPAAPKPHAPGADVSSAGCEHESDGDEA